MTVINELNIPWKIIIIILVILIGAAILTKVLRWLIDNSFVAASEKLSVDPTRYKFLKNAVSFIVWLIAFGAMVSFIPSLKNLAITLFAGAGILVAIIGFAAQEAFSNIIGGFFIVIFRPFRVGDMIRVGSLDYGIVEDITLRHTVMINFENKRIIIPNAVINNETIINDSIEDPKVCHWVEMGISYDSDVELATKILQEVAMSHPNCIDNRTKAEKKQGIPQVNVRLTSFGDFSVNLRAYVWTKDPFNAMQMSSDINKIVKKRFDREGVEIPFPYRTIVYKNDLAHNAKLNTDESK